MSSWDWFMYSFWPSIMLQLLYSLFVYFCASVLIIWYEISLLYIYTLRFNFLYKRIQYCVCLGFIFWNSKSLPSTARRQGQRMCKCMFICKHWCLVMSRTWCAFLEVLEYLRHRLLCRVGGGCHVVSRSWCSVRGPVVSRTSCALSEVLW